MKDKLNVFEKIWHRGLKRIPDHLREIKWWLQDLFRGYSDCDTWSVYSATVKKIYPMFKAFYKMEKHGLASIYFKDPDKTEHTDEEWEEAWQNLNEVLEKILFAFEFILYDDFNMKEKDRKKFEEKYGNIYEENEENRHAPIEYTVIDEKTGEKKKEKLFGKEDWYFNEELYNEFHKKKQEGIDLLAKYFFTFWD